MTSVKSLGVAPTKRYACRILTRGQLNRNSIRAYSSPSTTEADYRPVSSPSVVASYSRKAAKQEGSIASVFATLSGGSLSTPLPDRFRHLKKSIVKDEAHAKALQKAWNEILAALKKEIEEVVEHGQRLIPQVQYSGDEVATKQPLDQWLDRDTLASIRKRGTVIVKGVISEEKALQYKRDIRGYIRANPQTKGFPEDDPQVIPLFLPLLQLYYLFFHAPSQSSDTSRKPPADLSVSLSNPLSYCDRLRIRHPGDSSFALGPHIDGGGVERWEDEVFRGVWSDFLEMNPNGQIDWRQHDSWSLGSKAERLGAQTDMYSGAGACSVFRPLQGWLSMSSTGAKEGTLRVLPFLQSASAYIILRPFFRSVKELSECQGGDEEYLAAENWYFDLDNPHFPGCTLGRNIELDAVTHPHLLLEKTMTSIQRVQPGDCAFWHCDIVHAVESQHRGAAGQDSSVMYIPAIPLTRPNFDYILSQRQNFIEGIPPHDFPGGKGESLHVGRGTPNDVTSLMGRRAMGLEPFELRRNMPEAERHLIEVCNSLL